MKQKHKGKPRQHTDTALERIKALFVEAESAFPKDKTLSDRYVQLALKISTRYKTRLPQHLKKRFCKHCHSYLKPGENCAIRLNQGKVVYHCLVCDGCMRYPFRKGNSPLAQPNAQEQPKAKTRKAA